MKTGSEWGDLETLGEVGVIVLLLILAGCNSPPIITGSETPSPAHTTTFPDTTTPSPSSSLAPNGPTPSAGPITVVGGTLPIDVNDVWSRVQRLLGTDVTPPARVIVTSPNPTIMRRPPHFYSALTGINSYTVETWHIGASVPSPETVYIRWQPNVSTTARLEQVLVHEFTHVIQFRQNVLADANIPVTVKGALLQGTAIYVADVYTERYLNTTTKPSTRLTRRYAHLSPIERYFLRQNYYGYRYIAARIDSIRNLSTVYITPPQTTEQLLHPQLSTSDTPAQLAITINRTDLEWIHISNGTAGELFIRTALATNLSASAARTAAQGWGNDRYLTFWNGTAYGYVWVLRWDDAANATEFVAAMRRYISARNLPPGQTFRIERADTERVVVLFGSARFVTQTSVRTDNETIIVAID